MALYQFMVNLVAIENLSMRDASQDPENKMTLLYANKHMRSLTPLHVIRKRILSELDK